MFFASLTSTSDTSLLLSCGQAGATSFSLVFFFFFFWSVCFRITLQWGGEAFISWQSCSTWLQLFSCSDYSLTTRGLTMDVSSSQQRLLTSGQRWCVRDAHSSCVRNTEVFSAIKHWMVRSYFFFFLLSLCCCNALVPECHGLPGVQKDSSS